MVTVCHYKLGEPPTNPITVYQQCHGRVNNKSAQYTETVNGDSCRGRAATTRLLTTHNTGKFVTLRRITSSRNSCDHADVLAHTLSVCDYDHNINCINTAF